ncbi:MAG: hypothetical protein U0704_15355 [Candidatus Eisenbacteria bacterium]
MNISTTLQRGIATGLLATTLVLALAPIAEARNHRRYKGVAYGRHDAPARVIVRERSSAGPAIAGLIGGFILGAAVSHAQPAVVHEHECAPPPPRYRYYDPYCDEYLDDLDACRIHGRDHRHPRVVRVIEIDSGRCLRDLRWYDGGWHEDDMDWDD